MTVLMRIRGLHIARDLSGRVVSMDEVIVGGQGALEQMLEHRKEPRTRLFALFTETGHL